MKQINQKNELTKEVFSKKIEKYVEEHNTTYMDAIIFICNDYSIEYEFVSKLLNRTILEHLREERREFNLLPKVLVKTKNKLPF